MGRRGWDVVLLFIKHWFMGDNACTTIERKRERESCLVGWLS